MSRLSHVPRLCNLAVNRLVTGGNHPQIEALLDALTSLFSQSAPAIGSHLDQLVPGVRESVGVFWRDDPAGFPDEKARIADVGDNARNPARHRLAYHERECLAVCGRNR